MALSITPEQFAFMGVFLKEHSGYRLEPGKEYILESRLPGILRSAECADVATLLEACRRDPAGRAADALIQGMTINETMFFRDTSPFTNMTDHILPALTGGMEPRRLTFWCAACSSGQEPYSLAMVLDGVRHLYPKWDFHILATDLSEGVIARAKQGVYSDFEVGRGLSPDLRDRYFTPENGMWRAKNSLRDMIDFAPMNLLRIPPDTGPFDVILCRNVLIYFEDRQKTSILSALRKTSRTPGYLIPGATEILSDLSNDYAAHPSWKGVYITRG